MGMDIHLHIVDKDNNILHKEIFEGRNSEWFNNLMGEGWDKVYNYLPIKSYYLPDGFISKNINEITGKDWDEEDKAKYENWHFGYRTMEVGAFKEWFEKYKPHIDAGWVSTYEKWEYEVRGIIPEDVSHYKGKEDNDKDLWFITFENKYDCSKWLYNWLIDHHVPNDALLVYYFDN